jgi:hypothetical protein
MAAYGLISGNIRQGDHRIIDAELIIKSNYINRISAK